MTNDEHILQEVEGIINQEAEAIELENSEQIPKSFKRIEQEIFNSFGFNDPAHMFLETLVAIGEAEVEKAHTDATYDGVNHREIYGDMPKGAKPNRMSRLELVAQGDAFEYLTNRLNAIELATRDNLKAFVVRAPIFASAQCRDENCAPKDATDKEEGVLTIMVCDAGIYAISRFKSDPNNTDEMAIDPEEYEMGDMKFVDALIMFWFMPRTLREMDKELFDATHRDLLNKERKENRDNGK